MRFYRKFRKNVDGVLTAVDTLTYTAVVKTSPGGATVESPTPVKASLGLYYIDLTDELYDSETTYEITGTFTLVAGHTQVYTQKFIPAASGGGDVTITLPVEITFDLPVVDMTVVCERE